MNTRYLEGSTKLQDLDKTDVPENMPWRPNIVELMVSFSLVDGVWRHFKQYLNYIVAVSFISGGNPPTCRIVASIDKVYHIML